MGIPLRRRHFLADQFRQPVQFLHRPDSPACLIAIQRSGGRLILRHDRCARKNRQILPAFADRIDPTSVAERGPAAPMLRVMPNRDGSAPLHSTACPETNMSPTPTSQVADSEPGQLLQDLERRQDDVLAQLDDLDAKLTAVLRGLGVTMDDSIDADIV